MAEEANIQQGREKAEAGAGAGAEERVQSVCSSRAGLLEAGHVAARCLAPVEGSVVCWAAAWVVGADHCLGTAVE